MNKRIFAAFILLFLSGSQLFAQIGLSLKLNRTTYMIHEPIHVFVTLRNDTGRSIVFGEDSRLKGFILFEIRDRNNRLITKIPNSEIDVSNLLIRAGETKPLFFQINRFYNLTQPGLYRVKVYISHPQLPSDYESEPVVFWIASGSPIWSKTVGMPDLTGDKENMPTEERTYSIRALFDGQVRYFYLVVEDDEHIYGVIRLGKSIGQEKVQAEVDMLSRIHLLVPISVNVRRYLAFSLDGTNIIDQYWKNTETIPTLIRNKNGKVFVAGGTPAIQGVDYKTLEPNQKNATQLIQDYEKAYQRANPNAGQGILRNDGLVDLGKDLEK